MFIVESNPNREMQVILRGVKKNLGHVPPHWELFATIHPERFKMFLSEINDLVNHPSINPDFFAMMRFYIASQHGFAYCYNFNQAMLLSRGYILEALNKLEASTKNLPMDAKHKALFEVSVEAIEDPERFTQESIEKLKAFGWSDADIYDAVDHAAFLFKFSKILRAYSDSK